MPIIYRILQDLTLQEHLTGRRKVKAQLSLSILPDQLASPSQSTKVTEQHSPIIPVVLDIELF